MPFIRIETNVEKNHLHAAEFLKDLSILAAGILGKPEGFVMVSGEFGKHLMFGGSDDRAAYVRLESLGLAESDCPGLAAELCAFFQDKLEIPMERVYIGFASPERTMFGWNGKTFG